MESFHNLELLSVGISIAGTALLGVVMLLNNSRSTTNRSFFYFSFITVCWSIVNYAYYQLPSHELAFWLLRLVVFFAAWHAYTFYNFTQSFPDDAHKPSKTQKYFFFPGAIFISLLTLTPFVFKSVSLVSSSGNIVGVQNGIGIVFFGLYVLVTIIFGIVTLTKKTFSTTKELRRPYESLLYGVGITFLLLICFNFVLPAALGITTYIPLGALFLLPFVLSSAYAILHYKLFSIRVAAVAVLSFFLSTSVFLDIIFSQSLAGILFTSSEFVLVLIFSFWLIQGVLREVKQREHIQQLANELEKANKQQVVLIHFITHQIKGFLTKSRNIYSMILEGDVGEVSEQMKTLVTEGFNSDTKGVATVQEILNAANIKSGQVTYTMAEFDFASLVRDIVADLKPAAEKKQILLEVDIPEDNYHYNGDHMQLQNAIKNIIDNAIKYTPSGTVSVSLKKQGSIIRFTEKDTGVGITAEDMKHLFTEGGHGKESIKVNVESTGFGLYIVKNIIDAHHGKIWAESEGPNKGSTFVIELPLNPE